MEETAMLVRVRNYPTVNPWFNDVMDVDRHIQNLFGDIFDTAPASRYGRYPLFDLAEYENESVLSAEMPGVRKEDLKISVDNGYLIISGERRAYEMPEGSNWIRNEIRTGRFTRSIELPHEVNADNISAELQNGILRITLPKAETIKPREIRIK
jgi:HSP20 family protein